MIVAINCMIIGFWLVTTSTPGGALSISGIVMYIIATIAASTIWEQYKKGGR